MFYPWWCRDLEISYEQFGPYSPVIATVFENMLEQGQCILREGYLEVQPVSIEEKFVFPEITELFIQKLLSYSLNPILCQFETLEVFSIISVEQEAMFRFLKILRRMNDLDDDQRTRLIQRVLQRMEMIPHLHSFIQERGLTNTKQFLSEMIDSFYEALNVQN